MPVNIDRVSKSKSALTSRDGNKDDEQFAVFIYVIGGEAFNRSSTLAVSQKRQMNWNRLPRCILISATLLGYCRRHRIDRMLHKCQRGRQSRISILQFPAAAVNPILMINSLRQFSLLFLRQSNFKSQF